MEKYLTLSICKVPKKCAQFSNRNIKLLDSSKTKLYLLYTHAYTYISKKSIINVVLKNI